MRVTTIVAAMFVAMSFTACAQTKKSATSAGDAIVVTEATAQNMIPGRQDPRSGTVYHFQCIWKSKTKPVDLFFRPDESGWRPAHFVRKERKPMFEGSGDFMEIEKGVPFKDVQQGDKLLISVELHEHDPVPPTARPLPTMCLYYHLADAPTKWRTVRVTLKKLPDLQGL